MSKRSKRSKDERGTKSKGKRGTTSSASYLTPGVYVEEVSSWSKPIEGVGTSIAAFVGVEPSLPELMRRHPVITVVAATGALAAVAVVVRRTR